MAKENVTFPNRDGLSLAATLDLPEGTPRGYALFAHCFNCSRNISAVRRISRGLLDAGIGVLSFDFTGLGESEGEFGDSNFAHQTDDLLAAAGYMERTRGTPPELLVGHSLGGTAVLYAARKLPKARGVVTIGSPADPAHVFNLFDCTLEEMEESGVADVNIGGRPFSVKREFVEDLRAHPPESWLPELRKNLLLFHSPLDRTVGIENAQRIFAAVKHPKSFVSLDRSDHLLTQKKDAQFVAKVTSAWAGSVFDW